MKKLAIDRLGFYYLLDPEFVGEDTLTYLCRFIDGFLKFFLTHMGDADPSEDDLHRLFTFTTHWPAGAGWKNAFKYA